MIVVDTNVIAYCWIAGAGTQVAQGVRRCDPEWHVPLLWRSELRSTLMGYVWRGDIAPGRAVETMAAAEESFAGYEHEVSSARVLQLAAASRLSAYDCEFVALAEAFTVPLVTEDRAILKAFPAVALSMEDFLERFPANPPAAHQRKLRYRKSTLDPGPSPRLRRPG